MSSGSLVGSSSSSPVISTTPAGIPSTTQPGILAGQMLGGLQLPEKEELRSHRRWLCCQPSQKFESRTAYHRLFPSRTAIHGADSGPSPGNCLTLDCPLGHPVGRYCWLLFGIGGGRLGIGSAAVSEVPSPWQPRVISFQTLCGYGRLGRRVRNGGANRRIRKVQERILPINGVQ